MIDRRTALTSAVVLGLGTLTGLGHADAQQKAPKDSDEGKGRPARGGHPHMRAAMRHLRLAAQQLEQAAHDYGGHRAKALELVKQAEEEMKLAAEYVRSQQKDKGAEQKK